MGKINYDNLILKLKDLIEKHFQENPIILKHDKNYSNLNNLASKLLMNYDKIVGENCNDFFYSENENNKILHNKIVNIIKEEFSKYPEEEYSQIELENAMRNNQLDYELIQFILTYFTRFINNGFIPLDNPNNPIDHLKFNPNTTTVYYHAKRKKNIANNLAGIILEDGTILMSPTIHLDLIMYLCANSIDIKKAIKIEQMDTSREFNLSSLKSYSFTLKFPIENNIILSKDQAKAVVTLYKKINNIKSLHPIEDSLIFSSGLGIREQNGIGDENLKLIDQELGVGNLKTEIINNIVSENNRFY